MSDTAAQRQPNFVVIFCDNLGYGDMGCYGHPVHRTPNVDRMAEEGMRFTDFYVTSGVCTPSRASLMTGCYAQRVDMHVSDTGGAVLQPIAAKGLNPDEITIADLLGDAGYATACIGKWHLGDQPPFLPTRQGFDRYYGIPYSEDMTPRPQFDWPPLPLMRDEEVIEAPVHLPTITERYTEEAIGFMEDNADRPFFLYLPQALPGSVRWPEPGPRFSGRSGNWAYGDCVEELDWSAGEVIRAIQRLGLDDNTLVIFLSDNGTPRNHGGSNEPLRGWGYSTWEGGMRVPCVMRWPGTIPAGAECSEVCTTMDFLPAFARLAGTEGPTDRTIDGRDISSLLRGEEGAGSPYEAFVYYHMEQLHAVRSGRWKLFIPREDRRTFHGDDEGATEALLFDMQADPGETTNVAGQQPEVVQRLMVLAEQAREELGDTDREARGRRPAGHYPNPTPRVLE
ncbi:MAG: sulfatase [Armatimonadota bacterium]|nr:sulfatase [Armatimonadota bacterium]